MPPRATLTNTLSWSATLTAVLVVAMFGTVGPALAAAPAADPGAVRALRSRAATLIERRARTYQEAVVDLTELQRDLASLGAELERAKLDSLAGKVRLESAAVANRLARETEAEAQLGFAIADALRARATRIELEARLRLVDLHVARDANLALASLKSLVPRLRASGHWAGLGDAGFSESRAYGELNRWDEALASSLRSAEWYAKAGKLDEELRSRVQTCQALRFLGRHPEALPIADSVIAIARRNQFLTPLGGGLLERASILRTLNRGVEAVPNVDEALAIDRARGDLRHELTTRAFRANLFAAIDRREDALRETDTLMAMSSLQTSRTMRVRALSMRVGILLRMGRAAEADSTLGRELETWERYRASLPSDEDRASVGDHIAMSYAIRARTRLQQGKDAEAWLASESGRAFALEHRVEAPAVPSLAAVLDDLRASKAALIQYDEPSVSAGNVFLLANGEVHGFRLQANISTAEVRAVLEGLSSSRPSRGLAALLQNLSKVLLADVVPRIPAGIERIVIVPPSGLQSVPFEALPLPGSTTGATLGSRWPLSYVPSSGIYALLERRGSSARGLTIVADPRLDPAQGDLASLEPTVRGAVLRPLPGAREEARRLGEPGATVLVGANATLQRVIDSPPAGVLHFATHAVSDPNAAPRGGLVLAGPRALLTPARIESLSISADLVTLGGCRTLGAKSFRSEGPQGLARSFLVAGARTVITTRWDVGDRATARFMEVFYDALRGGQARDVSLARARSRLLSEGYPSRDCWAFLVLGLGDRPVDRWRNGVSGRAGSSGRREGSAK